MNMQTTIERIAKHHLDLDTLETRKSDRLDFKEQAVWSIEDALKAAYLAGQADAQKNGLAALATIINAVPLNGGMVRIDGDELAAARKALGKDQ